MQSQVSNRLIYVSRASDGLAASFDAAVEQIVAVSQRNNAADDVTGLLVAADNWFVQVLEGPRHAVSKTFARIARDPRHDVFEIIQAGAADGRMFGRWSMVARTLSPRAAPLLDAMAQGGSFDPRTLDAAGALRLLLTVSAISDGALERRAV